MTSLVKKQLAESQTGAWRKPLFPTTLKQYRSTSQSG